jgi:CRP-like cAMP-binding protein
MTTITLFRNATNTQTIRAGQVLFQAGDAADLMYVVQEGEIDVLFAGTVLDTIGPGGIVGEMGLIEKRERSATAVARTDCTVVPIDERYFTRLTQQTPYFAHQVMQILASRLRRYLEAPRPAETESLVPMNR